MIIGLILLLLALFGGVQFYFQQSILLIVILVGWFIIIWAGRLAQNGEAIPFLPSLKWLFIPIFLSMLGNLDIYETTCSRLWLYILALAVLIISHHYLDDDKIMTGIYWAGWLWPGIYLLAQSLGWQDNRNIIAAWSIIFITIGLQKRAWVYLLLNLIILLILGCRGAILGVAVVIFVFSYHSSHFSFLKFAWPLFLLVALILWRGTSLRPYYWHNACDAFLSAPLFGIGPGGLKINQIIAEPGGGYQVHAHNALITWLAETGLVGLICLAVAGRQIYKSRSFIQRWQAAILAGIAMHSMVDEPLFWPGPLLGMALIISTIREDNDGTG